MLAQTLLACAAGLHKRCTELRRAAWQAEEPEQETLYSLLFCQAFANNEKRL